jgi:hypothetical protein
LASEAPKNLPPRIAQQIWPKIKRADDLLLQLLDARSAFLKGRPFKLGRRPLGAHQVVRFVEHLEPIPVEFALITGDVLHNLRAALDHTVYQLACAQLGEPTTEPYRWAAFPVAESEEKYKAHSKQSIGRLTGATVAAIDSLKPYRGGNIPLWRLSALDNIDKHRLVLTVASALTEADVGQSIPQFIPGLRTWPAEPICPLELGRELITTPASPGIVVRVGFDVGIDEPGIVRASSLVDTLAEVMGAVCDTVEALGPFLCEPAVAEREDPR